MKGEIGPHNVEMISIPFSTENSSFIISYMRGNFLQIEKISFRCLVGDYRLQNLMTDLNVAEY